MLPQDLKTDVLEIAEIAKACPDNLQARCFELLLSRYLEGLPTPATPPKVKKEQTPPPPDDAQMDLLRIPAKEIGCSELMPIIFRLS